MPTGAKGSGPDPDVPGHDEASQGDEGGRTGGDAPSDATIDRLRVIPIVYIKLVSKVSAMPKSNLPLSTLQNELKSLLGPEKTVKKMNMRELQLDNLYALEGKWAASQSSKVYSEAADLSAPQWENILFNNRILHGYNFHFGSGNLAKAPKRGFLEAFAIRDPNQGTQEESIPPSSAPKTKYLDVMPGIPPFYVHDDSTVTITEVQHKFQVTMAKEGFSSHAVEINGSAGSFGKSLPVGSIAGSWAKEKADEQTFNTGGKTHSLHVAYNFPRVVLELNPEALILSDQCKEDIDKVRTESDVKSFYQRYGEAFPTKVTLGGYLHSTRRVSEREHSHMGSLKEEIRLAAGLSFSSPNVSFGMNYAHRDSNTTQAGTALAQQYARLTWEARGGDTVLCSDPPTWASTVKDYRYWRIMEQEYTVSMHDMIEAIDPHLAGKLKYLGSESESAEGRKDRLRRITEAISSQSSARLSRIKNEYSQLGNTEFNEWIKRENKKQLEIHQGGKWEDLSRDQKIYYGLFLEEVKNQPNR
ncbi:hypothetical protein TWF696_007944 [Orbilia brochopaga]|uniref:MACPF-like domain-containing protein n=1 Tax=Orbilia brochopaga TaxID=3140254 RepID=A0AAV9UMS3_9PEZI